MVNVNLRNEVLLPTDQEEGDVFKESEILEKHNDFNEEGLYGLLVLPVIGIALSTLMIYLKKYQEGHIIRCINWIHRYDQGENIHQNEVELSTLEETHSTSVPDSNDESHHRHPHFWNNLFEYDSSITSSSQDILFMDSAVQTTFPEVSFAQEEIFDGFEPDASDLSTIDEDEVIYVNIKEIELNVEIIDPTTEEVEDNKPNDSSTTRSGKVYK